MMEALTGKTKPVQYDELEQLISDARTLVFDFEYPIFDETYKAILEKKILRYFIFNEIGDTPIPRWKLWLANRLNEIMPYYNQLYESANVKLDPFSTMNYKRSGDRTGNSQMEKTDTDVTTTEKDTTNVGKTVGVTTTKDTTKNADTPQSSLTGLENDTYMTSASMNSGQGSSTVDSNNDGTETGKVDRTYNSNGSNDTTETYLENLTGYSGTSQSKLLKEWRETFLNVDRMILKDLATCFMGVL